MNLLKKIEDKSFVKWPFETGMGALVNYIMTIEKPVPSNLNFGLLPKVSLSKEQRKNKKRKKIKKELAAIRAGKVFTDFMQSENKS